MDGRIVFSTSRNPYNQSFGVVAIVLKLCSCMDGTPEADCDQAGSEHSSGRWPDATKYIYKGHDEAIEANFNWWK